MKKILFVCMCVCIKITYHKMLESPRVEMEKMHVKTRKKGGRKRKMKKGGEIKMRKRQR